MNPYTPFVIIRFSCQLDTSDKKDNFEIIMKIIRENVIQFTNTLEIHLFILVTGCD